MTATVKKQVTFYQSIVCPRCQMTKVLLARALREHPDVEVTRVEFLTNMARAKADGISSIPALVSEGRRLTGAILTQNKIERFLASLGNAGAS